MEGQMTDTTNGFGVTADDASKKVADEAKQVSGAAATKAKEAGKTVGDTASKFGDNVSDAAKDAGEAAADTATTFGDAVADKAGDFSKVATDTVNQLGKTVSETATQVSKAVGEHASTAKDWALDQSDVLRDTVQTKPLISVGVSAASAFAAGLVLGILLTRD
jgi:ElaB/YqjD/DUF883 family membrane-anchored ribosome-binding protein